MSQVLTCLIEYTTEVISLLAYPWELKINDSCSYSLLKHVHLLPLECIAPTMSSGRMQQRRGQRKYEGDAGIVHMEARGQVT